MCVMKWYKDGVLEPKSMVQGDRGGRRSENCCRLITLEPLSSALLALLVGKDRPHSRDRERLPGQIGAKFVVASSLDRDLPKAAPRLGWVTTFA
jgi:hypothetical protein